MRNESDACRLDTVGDGEPGPDPDPDPDPIPIRIRIPIRSGNGRMHRRFRLCIPVFRTIRYERHELFMLRLNKHLRWQYR